MRNSKLYLLEYFCSFQTFEIKKFLKNDLLNVLVGILFEIFK